MYVYVSVQYSTHRVQIDLPLIVLSIVGIFGYDPLVFKAIVKTSKNMHYNLIFSYNAHTCH